MRFARIAALGSRCQFLGSHSWFGEQRAGEFDGRGHGRAAAWRDGGRWRRRPARTAYLVYEPAFFADAAAQHRLRHDRAPAGLQLHQHRLRRAASRATAGNVLIDGQRPTSKSDDLHSILTRIPAVRRRAHRASSAAARPASTCRARRHRQRHPQEGQTRRSGSSTSTENIFTDGHTVPGAEP